MSTQPSGFVILHFGPMPLSAMQQMSKMTAEDAVMDTNVARLAGASFAVGPREALDSLKERLVPAAIQQAKEEHPDLEPDALSWLVRGERGLSSDAIFSHLTDTPVSKPHEASAYPRDPDDLRRCRLLLEAVPSLQGQMSRMAALSPIWARLVDQWDALCAQMDAESPDWREGRGASPQTYDQMQALITAGRQDQA